MLKIAICDDRVEQIEKIKSSAERYFNSTSRDITIQTYDNSFLFLESLGKSGGFDIVLLDICMPEILGTDVAKEIRRREDRTEIVFLTTSDEYAVDAFALKAAHYLIKPFTQTQFDEALERAVSRLGDDAKSLTVKTNGGDVLTIPVSDIQYIESLSHSQMIHLCGGKCAESRVSLTWLMEELKKISPSQFILPYKGYLVNQRVINAIEPTGITLKSGATVPIVRRQFRAVRDAYFDYIFREEMG